VDFHVNAEPAEAKVQPASKRKNGGFGCEAAI